MIEKILYEFLKDNDIDASAQGAGQVVEDDVRIEKIGMSADDHLCTSDIVIQCYGRSIYKAAELSKKVRELLLYKLPEHKDIAGVKLNSEYNFTDTAAKRYRYQSVYHITHYEGGENGK